MKHCFFRASSLGILLLTIVTTTLVAAQRPAPRITQQIDPHRLVTLRGNTHPLARVEFDRGPAPDAMIAERMMLVLSRSDEQEKALRQLLDDQQTAGSPSFHKWLTPEEFGQQFGPPDSDIQTVTTWLLNNGFQVTSVSPGRNVIEFSGTAGQLRQVFHADLHKYVVNGKEHWANANDPEIPAALAPVVDGIASLNNFARRPQSHNIRAFKRDSRNGEASPLLTTGGTTPFYLISPGDFAVIYNSSPLIQAGNDGTGQKIAIAGRTNINLQDVTDFRNLFSLPNTPDNHTTVVLNGPDPGILDTDETEALLDVEWAGATAPGASIILVSSESTLTADGVDLSSLYIVEKNLASVMSVSYGTCEAGLLNAGNSFYQSLWEQAAAQGITVAVAAGDNGSAGCDDPNSQTVATSGIAVNGIASTPFNVAVGGTDFNDKATQTTYFNPTNTTAFVSAKSYVPEIPWNDSCAGGTSPTTSSCASSSNLQLWAGSGGPSSCSTKTNNVCSGTAKPAWQTGTGVPGDNVRHIPDVSLFAASGTAGSRSLYVICEADLVSGNPSCQPPPPGGGLVYLVTIAGTSASSPAFAGTVALANEKVGGRLGNLNYLMYPIAAQSNATCSTTNPPSDCIFHDVTLGGNSVPCQGGTAKCSATGSTQTGVLVDSNKLAYLAGTGYDQATGLGSPNVDNLVTAIKNATFTSTTTSLKLNGGTSSISAKHGDPISVAVNVSPTASTGPVSLIGNNGTTDNMGIDAAMLSGGAASWSSTLFPGGTYTVHAHYPGDGTRGASDSTIPGIPVNISAETSKTFVNLVTFDLNGHLTSFTANQTEYGAPYILRMDVGDSAATVSTLNGISSKCSNGTASCPTGTLTVTANGTPLDGGSWPLNNQGHSEDQPIQLPAGAYNVVASYPGDASYAASSGSTGLTVTKATTGVTVTAATPIKYGEIAPLSATVGTNSNGAAPTGTINFFDGGSPLNVSQVQYIGTPGSASAFAQLQANGIFYFLSLGQHNLSAQYVGDTNYAAVSGAATAFNVVQDTPIFSSINVSGSPVAGNPTTLTATLSTSSVGVKPTGTVTFSDGSTSLSGTVTYGGTDGAVGGNGATLTASMPYTFTAAGTHNITAKYSGDTNYATATSTPQAVQVAGPFNIVPGGAITVVAGQSGSTTLTVSSNNSFNGAVTLTCTPSGAETTCGFSQGSGAPQNSLTINLTGTDVPVTFTATTTAAHTVALNRLGTGTGAGIVFCGIFLFGIPALRRKSAVLIPMLIFVLILATASCGGGSSSGGGGGGGHTDPGTTRGTYNFAITGTTGSGSSAITVPAQVAVTVN